METISRAFNTGLATVGTFSEFTKTSEFWKKEGGVNILLNFTIHKKSAIAEDHSMSL